MYINFTNSIIHNIPKWEQLKHPLDKRTMAHHTMETYLSIKTNEVLIYAIMWMNLENIMISEEAGHKGHIL